MSNFFHGLGIALVTPFRADSSVDFDALRNIVEYQIRNGADFFCILATTAEIPTLTLSEKAKIKSVVVDTVNSRVPVIVGCGGNNTQAVCEELRTMDTCGIDAVLSVCPYYNKPTQEGLFQHFKAVSQASPLPVILYNVPGRTGVNLTSTTTLRLAQECSNIIAIKEASGNLSQIREILNRCPADFDVLSGDDCTTLQMIQMGAKGVISVVGNALTQRFSAMVKYALEGKYEMAQPIDDELKDLYDLLFVEGNPPGIKSLMSQMGMLENILRLPLVPVSDETACKLSPFSKI
ncbi:MAG: 4-hydroxy-tetrahydrodipicolinate synthase [Prevotellaceae bacterium]|nr:4-hydroxy-tetrahydrodipicolinate synthase [Prevotellaceae bacterium]